VQEVYLCRDASVASLCTSPWISQRSEQQTVVLLFLIQSVLLHFKSARVEALSSKQISATTTCRQSYNSITIVSRQAIGSIFMVLRTPMLRCRMERKVAMLLLPTMVTDGTKLALHFKDQWLASQASHQHCMSRG
jgi:hypothetical protein